MRWQNTAWALLEHIEFIQDRRHHRCGRGPVFKRDKASIYQRRAVPRQPVKMPEPEEPRRSDTHEEAL